MLLLYFPLNLNHLPGPATPYHPLIPTSRFNSAVPRAPSNLLPPILPLSPIPRSAVPGASIRSVKLDLANLQSVRECAQKLIGEGAADFDVVLNNAGGSVGEETMGW